MKPDYNFRKGTMIKALYDDDWSDLTISQIAEVLGSTYYAVCNAMKDILKKTGYRVPHAKEKPGRKIVL